MEYTTYTDHETFTVGMQFASALTGGMVVCLYGDLGAGKTTFVKGIANGLNIHTDITSPTFTLMNVYPVKNHPQIKQLVHVDTYRVVHEQELIAIGIEDYIGKPDCALLVEWPDKIESLFAGQTVVKVILEHSAGESRRITIQN